MSWRALTEADIATVMSGDELSTIKTLSLNAATSQTDAVADAIAAVALDVRAYIAANPSNQLEDGDTTVPTVLIRHASVLVRNGLLARVELEISEARKDEGRTARKFLEDVSRGNVAIPAPTTIDPDMNPQDLGRSGFATVDSNLSTKRTARRCDSDGLL